MTYDVCTDCNEPCTWISDDNDRAVSDCCAAPVKEIPLAHGDDCCCRDCDPSGIVQSYYATTGRVL